MARSLTEVCNEINCDINKLEVRTSVFFFLSSPYFFFVYLLKLNTWQWSSFISSEFNLYINITGKFGSKYKHTKKFYQCYLI